MEYFLVLKCKSYYIRYNFNVNNLVSSILKEVGSQKSSFIFE